MTFAKIVENPFYDEDGQCVDEDMEACYTQTIDDEDGCGADLMDTSPYSTINS
jgi:hypothetical protein